MAGRWTSPPFMRTLSSESALRSSGVSVSLMRAAGGGVGVVDALAVRVVSGAAVGVAPGVGDWVAGAAFEVGADHVIDVPFVSQPQPGGTLARRQGFAEAGELLEHRIGFGEFFGGGGNPAE